MFNNKRVSSITNILIATVIFSAIAGCGAKTVITEVTENSSSDAVISENTDSVATANDSVKSDVKDADSQENTLEKENDESTAADASTIASTTSLPAYEYPGPESFYVVLYDYLIDEFGQYYDDYDVCIPSPQILDVDMSDKSDIKAYGDFWVYNYNLDGDTLMCVSGGSFPGLIRLKYDLEKGFVVTGMDIVADGSDFDSSAKKIFGDKYDAFISLTSDHEALEKTRAQIIANYVAANNLSISKYQDYGWDPVTLPEENIDNFYGDLN